MNKHSSIFNMTVLVTGLGFLVDMYDTFSFNMIRHASLSELGLSGDVLTRAGVHILNAQVIATLIGGIFWGMLGDKFGRKKCLVGSILVYSLGMLATAAVQDVTTYILARIVTGFGIAGELGLGAVLVAEKIVPEKRGYAIGLFTGFGLAGIILAGVMSELLPWRHFCLVGAGMGLGLLGLRIFLIESGLFTQLSVAHTLRGRYSALFSCPRRFKRYICGVLILVPNFFLTGILLTLSGEFSAAAGVTTPVKTSYAMIIYFTCALAGDFFSTYLTARIKSRRATLLLYIFGNLAVASIILGFGYTSAVTYYALCGLIGVFNCWAIVNLTITELMGTDLRATSVTSSINFSRAFVAPMSVAMLFLKPDFGIDGAGWIVMGIVCGMALISAWILPETYNRDVDFHEFHTENEDGAVLRRRPVNRL
jgi:putative MFS transporter